MSAAGSPRRIVARVTRHKASDPILDGPMHSTNRPSRYRPPCPYCGTRLKQMAFRRPFPCPNCGGILDASRRGWNWYRLAFGVVACLLAYVLGLRGVFLVMAVLPIWFAVMGVTLFFLGLLMPPQPRPYGGPINANASSQPSRYRPPCPYCGAVVARINFAVPFPCPNCHKLLEAPVPGGRWYIFVSFGIAALAAYALRLRGSAQVLAIFLIWFVVLGLPIIAKGILVGPTVRPYQGSKRGTKPHYLTLGISGPARKGELANRNSNQSK